MDRLYLTLGSGNSFKPALVLRQTGRNCERHFIDVLAGQTRSAQFLAINPRGQVPYLVTEAGVGLGESNAIAWYLAEGTPLMPSSAITRAQAMQWMIFEQTLLEPNISPARFFTHILPDQKAAHAAEIPRWIESAHRGLELLGRHLTGRDFVTDGGYSVADIAVYGYTHLAEEAGVDLGRHPAVQAWMARVRATPQYAPIDVLLAC